MMEDGELQRKNNYSSIKDPNDDEKVPECTNLLRLSDKNTTNSISKTFQLENKVEVNYGKNKILLYHKGEPLVVLGPHWPFFICLFTIIVMFLIPFMVFVWTKLNIIGRTVGVLIISIQVISYLITVFANPGFPRKLEETEINAIERGKGMQYCKRCGFFIKPGEGTFHCFECDVCIVGYDHHCPWASKCIGKNNLISFYFFITSTTFLFAYLILSLSLIDA